MTADDPQAASQPRRIGIVLFTGVEELDAIGPWEVLTFWAERHALTPVEVRMLGLDDGIIECAKGLRVLADDVLSSDTSVDVLVHPGGRGTRPLATDPAHLQLVRTLAARGTMMTSVCTGSLVYAAAGLLHDRRATTHWSAIDELRALDDSVTVVDERWVDEGDIITSAGVSAGIDMALHLIDRLDGPAVTDQVARGIQYDHWVRPAVG